MVVQTTPHLQEICQVELVPLHLVNGATQVPNIMVTQTLFKQQSGLLNPELQWIYLSKGLVMFCFVLFFCSR